VVHAGKLTRTGFDIDRMPLHFVITDTNWLFTSDLIFFKHGLSC